MESIENHRFFTDKEMAFLRAILGEYTEVILPSDIHFIIKHTGVCWSTVIKYLAFNGGDISTTIIELY